MQNQWLLIAGGAFWSANLLAAGIWLGFRLARHRQSVESPNEPTKPKADNREPWPPLGDALRAGVAQSEVAAEKARRLSTLCEGPSPAPVQALAPAIRDLTGAVLTLHAQVASMYTVFTTFWRAESLVEELRRGPHNQGDAAADLLGRRSKGHRLSGMRFPYPCRQWAAPCVEGRLPDAGDFFQVQCQELDQDGIAVYVDGLLPAEKVVISLGSDEGLVFMLARVISEHAQPADKPGKYLLECRFIQRLAEQNYSLPPLAAGVSSSKPR
jgi:hypothetical protein